MPEGQRPDAIPAYGQRPTESELKRDLSANGAAHARGTVDLHLVTRGKMRGGVAMVGCKSMERAFSPYDLHAAFNLGRWPRVVWGAPLALAGRMPDINPKRAVGQP